jgi:methyltransferase (TIGR00027 family)
MRADRPSDTAAYVAMGRALAHARGAVRGFSDPFALDLLPDDCRVAVLRRLRREWPRTRREALLGIVGRATERLMAPRTLEIDDGLRSLPPGHQLVILGAGLDARAYRLRELSASVAFEVDHPASQAYKLGKVQGLAPCTRDLRHVPIDFTRERLGEVLARAGHEATVPTAWVFEGVISYLDGREVEEAVDGMAARSAPGSLLLATYNEPSLFRQAFDAVVPRSPEPQRASFRPAELGALLAARGFAVRSDRDGLERARRWGVPVTAAERIWIRFHHVVIADFRRTAP